MSDRLTVILPPVLSEEDLAQGALELCCGSLTEGGGYGCGYGCGYGRGYGDDYGRGRGDGWDYDYGRGWGDGDGGGGGGGYGDDAGDGKSATRV